ncbi:MAG: hypothetical protein LAP21_09630 [Acidobacteriia bacterium]|nr:hypothetical protein [Terriglobia bacterium]
MKKAILIILAVVVAAVVALAMAGVASPGTAAAAGTGVSDPGYSARLMAGLKARMTDGKTEIQRALEARKNVTSFRMKTVLRMHPGQPLETVAEVSCPDRERFTTTIGDSIFHAVRIGNKAYVEQKDGTWTTQETPPTGWSPCGDNPGEPAPWAVMNEGRDPSVVMAKMVDQIEATRGAFIATSDGNCQEWMLNIKIPGGASHGHGASGLRYTLCMDPNQHRPVSITMGSGGMVTTYSDWNKPIQIDAPKEAQRNEATTKNLTTD